MISANGGLLAHRYTPQVTQRWPRGSEPASPRAPCSRPVNPGREPPGRGKAPRRRESRPQHRERPDRTWRGAPMRGHEARLKGTLPATAGAQGQVPRNNGHRLRQTREARTTHDEPRHGSRCQGKPGPTPAQGTHSKWVAGPGRTPLGRAFGRGRAPDLGRSTPRQEASPPPAPSCRPHSVQIQLARARAVRLVTDPHAHSPPAH